MIKGYRHKHDLRGLAARRSPGLLYKPNMLARLVGAALKRANVANPATCFSSLILAFFAPALGSEECYMV